MGLCEALLHAAPFRALETSAHDAGGRGGAGDSVANPAGESIFSAILESAKDSPHFGNASSTGRTAR
jgi:hypothetical protein